MEARNRAAVHERNGTKFAPYQQAVEALKSALVRELGSTPKSSMSTLPTKIDKNLADRDDALIMVGLASLRNSEG